MSAPTLQVLALQAEHVRQQADCLRQHCTTRGEYAAGDAWSHLAKAVAYCDGIDLLARHVHACLTCAMEAQKPLPVCAGDAMERAAAKAHDEAGNTPPPAVDLATGKVYPW